MGIDILFFVELANSPPGSKCAASCLLRVQIAEAEEMLRKVDVSIISAIGDNTFAKHMTLIKIRSTEIRQFL